MPDKIAQIGRQAALAAGAVMRRNYQQPHLITMKGAIDPVTETDFQCQEIIIGMIRQAFPDHGFLAEERGGEGEPVKREPAGLAWESRSLTSRLPLDHRPPGRHRQLRPRVPHVLRVHRLGGGRQA